MQRTLLLTTGFFLAGTGILSLLLSFVGVQFSFLSWMDQIGLLFSFVMKMMFILIGFILMVLSQTDFKEQD